MQVVRQTGHQADMQVYRLSARRTDRWKDRVESGQTSQQAETNGQTDIARQTKWQTNQRTGKHACRQTNDQTDRSVDIYRLTVME